MQDKTFLQRYFPGRRGLALFLVLVVLLSGGWAFRRYVVAERYRPLIEAELSRLFGLPVSIRGLDFAFFPSPRLLGYDVCIGEDDFRLESPVVEARARLWPLFRRQVVFTSIDGDGAVMVLPADDHEFVAKWDTFFENFDPPRDKKPGKVKFTFFIDRIRTPGLIVRRGEAISLHGNVVAEEVISVAPRLGIKGSFPYFGETTRIEADLSFPREGDAPTHLEGSVQVSNVFLDALAGLPSAPDFHFGMAIHVRGELPEGLEADIEGQGHLGGKAMSQAGKFLAKAWWRDNRLIVNDAEWRSPGFDIVGDATWTPGAGVVCRIPSAEATGEGLGALLAAFSSDRVSLRPEDDAWLRVTDFLFGTDGRNAPRLVSGEMAFDGIDVLAELPGAPEAPERREAYDDVRGRIRVDEGAFLLEEVAAAEFSLSGRIAPGESIGSFYFDLAGEMTLSRERLAPWMELERIESLEGLLTVSHLSGLIPPEGGFPSDFHVEARLAGVNLALIPVDATETVRFEEITGGLVYAGDTLRIEEITGKGFTVTGAFGFEDLPDGRPFDLSGQADLAGALPRLILADIPLRDLQGTAHFTRLSGLYVPGEPLPRDLTVEGRIEQGAALADLPGLEERLQGLDAEFTSDGASVRFEGRIAAETLGALAAQGLWTVSSQTLSGMLSADWGGFGKFWSPEGVAGSYWAAALSGFGASELDFTVRLPQSAGGRVEADFQRRGEPALDAKITLISGPDGLRPDVITVESQIPLAWFTGVFPAAFQAEGDAALRFRLDKAESPFLLDIDFAQATLRGGPYLTKRAGDPAALAIQGVLDGEDAGLRHVEVQCLGESLLFRQTASGLQSEGFQVQLGPLARLLPENATASGAISGSFAPEPLEVDLHFEAAALIVSEELGLDRIDGAISYAGDAWRCRDLHWQGGDSDVVLNADRQHGVWRASITGAKLNLNAIERLYEAITGWTTRSEADAAPREAPTGEILADIGSVYYRRAQIDNVQTRIQLDGDGISFQEILLRPHGGEVEGAARLSYASEGEPRRLRLQAGMKSVDARILDELFFPEPRGLLGSVDADIDLRFPIGDGSIPQNGMSGTASFTARNGTYGKLGFATTLLTVLRTTEIIRLRIPTLKDEGLVFDLSEGRLVMEDGVMNIETAELTGKAYALTASGTADFPQDNTDVVVYVYTLESVTGIVSAVPLLGRGMDILKGTTALRGRVTGSPLAVNVRLETPSPVRGLFDRISR